jgi:hypothetical protein
MSTPNTKFAEDVDAPSQLRAHDSGRGSTDEDIPDRQRSKSVDIPRKKMINQLKAEGGFRTHFMVNHADDLPSAEGTRPKRRPAPISRGTSYKSFVYSVKSNRKSMARTLSSYSTSYSHFAGENWVEDEDVPGLAGMTAEELALSESEKAEMRRPERTASFGKAMFMFLKAFIGSGLMFLPKA